MTTGLQGKKRLTRRARCAVLAMAAIAVLALVVACNSSAPTANDGQAAGGSLVQSTAVVPAAAATQQALALATPTNAPAQSPAEPTAAQAAAATSAPTQAAASQASAPACTSPATLTPAETEGPYFKAGSPERASLLTPGMSGTKLVLTGYVLTADCKPVANALLDFWQADANGNYDNSGYMLRGHQYTGASGRFTLATVVPGLYPGRTEHIHVKVQAPGGPVVTTQLYFPGVSENSRDGIFDPMMVMNVQKASDGLAATFNFVISTK